MMSISNMPFFASINWSQKFQGCVLDVMHTQSCQGQSSKYFIERITDLVCLGSVAVEARWSSLAKPVDTLAVPASSHTQLSPQQALFWTKQPSRRVACWQNLRHTEVSPWLEASFGSRRGRRSFSFCAASNGVWKTGWVVTANLELVSAAKPFFDPPPKWGSHGTIVMTLL